MKEKSTNPEYCVITEQGDLGLGAEVLNEQDQEAVKKALKKEDKDN